MAAAAKAGARGRKQTAPTVLVEHRNEVAIVGRLSKPAEIKVLPSGDEVVQWRLVVDRPEGGPRRSFDAIDCTAFAARIRRSALSWKPGATIEVAGALRRRFWRGNAGLASTYEVHVASVTKRSD
jgi:single-strand DNA-binding protein